MIDATRFARRVAERRERIERLGPPFKVGVEELEYVEKILEEEIAREAQRQRKDLVDA